MQTHTRLMTHFSAGGSQDRVAAGFHFMYVCKKDREIYNLSASSPAETSVYKTNAGVISVCLLYKCNAGKCHGCSSSVLCNQNQRIKYLL